MENWVPISDLEVKRIWHKIYKELKFKPSIRKFPSFKAPIPFITYDISNLFEDPSNVDLYDDLYNELEEKALNAFREITSVDEFILALDWQHECYWVNPHLKFNKNEFGEWIIPIVPNGDYYFFVQKELDWGFLGHPWEQSITIFGEELIRAFQKQNPRILYKILRQS
ncbi:DUF2716 domain-containing protein [Priestia aryabhattai]